jgi:ABC-type transport system substrate-binding protein
VKKVRSAGGYFVIHSVALGDTAGFTTSWLYFLYDPVIVAAGSLLWPAIFTAFLSTYLGIDLPWWPFAFLMAGTLFVVTFVGSQMEGAQFFTPVDSVTTPDDKTIVWKLKTPYPDLEHVLGYQYLLMHPGDRVLNDPGYWSSPVSAGPYMLSQWKPGTNSTLLQANPKYVLGPMMAQQLELVTVTDTTSRTLQLTNGTLDFAFELPFSAATTLGSSARPVPHPQGARFT